MVQKITPNGWFTGLSNALCWIRRRLIHFALVAMIVGLLLVYFWPLIVVTIPAGHLGVRWHRFGNGTDLGEPMTEGTRLKFPWDRVYIYDMRLRVVAQTFHVITSDGLSIKTSISFRFHINPSTVGLLHKNIGPNFVKVLLTPEIGSSARVLVARYTAQDFYTTARLQAQLEILEQIRLRLSGEGINGTGRVSLINLDDVMINEITLPGPVQAAINRKIEAYENSLEYTFRLESERKEAQRKQIEGQGVRVMFDEIGKLNLDSYLRLVGVNATVQLANSPNTKIVITGSGSFGGMPLLLDGNSLDSSSARAVSSATGTFQLPDNVTPSTSASMPPRTTEQGTFPAPKTSRPLLPGGRGR